MLGDKTNPVHNKALVKIMLHSIILVEGSKKELYHQCIK